MGYNKYYRVLLKYSHSPNIHINTNTYDSIRKMQSFSINENVFAIILLFD